MNFMYFGIATLTFQRTLRHGQLVLSERTNGDERNASLITLISEPA